MKRILAFICLIIFILPTAINLYAQGGYEAGMSPVASFNTYRMPFLKGPESPPAADTSAFLKEVNADYIYYHDSPVTKGSDGLINTTTFWTEVPREIYNTTAESNVISGLTFGFARGLIYGFGRGAAGLIDTTTCIVPPYDEPLIDPGYKVKNSNKDGFKITVFSW